MRRCLLAVVLAAFLLSVGAPATAGGGWWDWISVDDTYLTVGESAWAETEAFQLTEKDVDQGTPYYAYLVRGFDQKLLQEAYGGAFTPDRWWALEPDAELVRLGRVRVSGLGMDARARARFEVPDVEPGRYDLMLCDAGCVRPLGDAVPTEVQISADAIAVDAFRKARAVENRLRRRVDSFGVRLSAARDATAVAENRAAAARRAVSSLIPRIQELEAAASQPTPPTPPAPVWPGVAGAGLLLGAAALLVLARRRPRAQEGTDAGPADGSGGRWEQPAPLVGAGRSRDR